MPSFILHRFLSLIPTLLGIIVAVFLMVHLVPGDPAQVMLGERASAQSLAEVRAEMGLDQPLHVQLGRFLSGLAKGDLGRSIKTHEPIWDELKTRFPATVELALASMLFASVFGITAGVFSAIRRGSAIDYTGMTASLVGVSMPIFWLGLILILIFSVKLGLFPISGRIDPHAFVSPTTGFLLIDSLLTGNLRVFGDTLRHLVLPAVTLGTVPMAVISRMTRSSMLEVLHEDYIRTAQAKGLSEWATVSRHAMRNSFIPVLTVMSMEFGYLLGGAVITETIFAWPGVGRWLLLAVEARDFRAVQGGVLLLSTVFILINLVADVLYAWLDPRIKYQ